MSPKLDQVLRLNLREQFSVTLITFGEGGFLGFVGAETHGALAQTTANGAFEPDERAAADEQNVGGIYRREFLVRMLASTLRWDVRHSAFQDLQQCLLHALAGDVASNRRVLVFAANLVNFVDIDDASLGSRHVAIGRLQELQDDVFNVLTHIAGFGKRSGIHNGKRNIKHFRQGLGEQCLARARRPNQHDVRLGQFHFAAVLAVHVNPFVVVVNRDGKLLLGLLLADDVFVEERLRLSRLGQLVGRGAGLGLGTVVFQNGIADGDALIADVGARIVGGRGNQLGDGVL